MRCLCILSRWLLALTLTQSTLGQTPDLPWPKTVEAGNAFSVATTGSGGGTLYIVGPAETLRRNVQLGESVLFGPNDLHNAGHYIALLIAGPSTENAQFDVVASHQPASLSFIAKPSRLAVNQSNGISGVAYVFDVFHNLVLHPQQVSFELSSASGSAQSRTVATSNGVAWVRMNSAPKAGLAQFEATAGSVREKRVVQQVPGDPCTIRMSAREVDQRLLLETEPVRDCSGNAVPDGTIVTFTETYSGSLSTVDVPLKRGIAKTEMPARKGAVISVASGVAMGNEIRWNGGQ